MKIEQEYEVVELGGDVDVLKPHPQNPNKGDEGLVAESVEVNGWYGAVIAQKSTGYVLAGHTRLRVAEQQGAESVPVIWKDVDDETALRILLADNETARAAAMDADLVGQILDQLGDIRGTGHRNGAVDAESEAESESEVDATVDALEAEEKAEEDLGNIPDDVYEPQYAVMLVVETEEAQEALYQELAALVEDAGHAVDQDAFSGAKLRVVAV